MKKQFLGLLLSFLMGAWLLQPIVTQAETTDNAAVVTGEAGENVTYSHNKSTKTMTFSGSGKLLWLPDDKPYDDVEKVVIEEGITELDLWLGEYFHGLQELTIPKSVQKINGKTLKDNYNLRKIYNYSSAEFDPRYGGVWSVSHWNKKSDVIKNGKKPWGSTEDFSPMVWKVNGQEVTKIPAGSVATATPKKYKIQYDLKGGKKKGGSWIKSYTYGSEKELPKPKKKGYLFAGWKTDGNIYFPTWAFTKISPIHYSDVKLTAIWRKIKIVKNKKKRTLQVLVWPKKYPQLTVLVSTKKNIKKALKNPDVDGDAGIRRYSIAGTGKKSKTKNGMRVYNIKEFGGKFNTSAEKFKKGKTYYIWIKYGTIRNFEYSDVNDEGVKYVTDDAYYFYKTKIKF